MVLAAAALRQKRGRHLSCTTTAARLQRRSCSLTALAEDMDLVDRLCVTSLERDCMPTGTSVYTASCHFGLLRSAV